MLVFGSPSCCPCLLGKWWTPWCGTSRCRSLETDSLATTGRGTCTQHIHCQLGETGLVFETHDPCVISMCTDSFVGQTSSSRILSVLLFFSIYCAFGHLLPISPRHLFFNSFPSAHLFLLLPLSSCSPSVSCLSIFRWIWRWLCQVRGKIRRSRCLCSGCLWSVFRCCWRPCQVTLTRFPKTPFRLWMSSPGICLPWGTDTRHLCVFSNAPLASF